MRAPNGHRRARSFSRSFFLPLSHRNIFFSTSSPRSNSAERLHQLYAHRTGPILICLPLLLLVVEVQRRQPQEATFGRHGLGLRHFEHRRALALDRDGDEKLLLAQLRRRDEPVESDHDEVWLPELLCRRKHRRGAADRALCVRRLDVLERPPRKHPSVRLRHSGLRRRGQRRVVQVRHLLDQRLRLLQVGRGVRQLRELAAAASEPRSDAEPRADDAAAGDQTSSSDAGPNAPPSSSSDAGPNAPPSSSDAGPNAPPSSPSSDAGPNAPPSSPSDAGPNAPPSSPSHSRSLSPFSGRRPRHEILGLDQLPRRRHLVAPHRGGVRPRGAHWPRREVPSSQVHPLGDGGLRYSGICGTLCYDQLRRGGLGE